MDAMYACKRLVDHHRCTVCL